MNYDAGARRDVHLDVARVSKTYGDVLALQDVSLRARRGEILSVLGPNGAGKTTLIGITSGLIQPDDGSVYIDGVDVGAQPHIAKRLLGLAPQELGIYPTITVFGNLVYFGYLAGRSKPEAHDQADRAAGLFDIHHLMSRRAGRLSGGERRRLHSAMALMGRGRCLLLDEPTAGVDVQTRRRVLDGVSRLARDGYTIVYTTHYLEEVEHMDTAVAVLVGGRIVAEGSVAELKRRHAGAAVELTFAGEPPPVPPTMDWVRDGQTLRIDAAQPERELARFLAHPATTASAERLLSVNIVRPSLETVFLNLTGRHLSVDGELGATAPPPYTAADG